MKSLTPFLAEIHEDLKPLVDLFDGAGAGQRREARQLASDLVDRVGLEAAISSTLVLLSGLTLILDEAAAQDSTEGRPS